MIAELYAILPGWLIALMVIVVGTGFAGIAYGALEIYRDIPRGGGTHDR